MEVSLRAVRWKVCWTLCSSISVLNGIYVWLLLPESRRSCEIRPDTEIFKARSLARGPSHNPFRYFRLLRGMEGASGVTSYMRRISGIVFFLYVAKMSILSVAPLFVQQRYGVSPGDAGMLASVWGIMQFLSMSVVGSMRASIDERVVAWVGLVSGFVGTLIFYFNVQSWMVWLGQAVCAISMVTLTALSSYAGRLVSSSMLGEVQGLIATMTALTEAFGPPFFGSLTDILLRDRNAPWWIVNLGFGLGAFCIMISMVLMTHLPHVSKAMILCGRTFDQSVVDVE